MLSLIRVLPSNFSIRKIPKMPTVKVGAEIIEVRPMGLENTLRFLVLIAPYLSRLRYGLGAVLRERGVYAPGEITLAFALLIDRDVEWVARNATARDLVEAIPVLDEINNFGSLFQAAKALGVIDG